MNKLYVNQKNKNFMTNYLNFLGFVISFKGIKIDQEKLKDIKEWLTWKTVEESAKLPWLGNILQKVCEEL